MYQHCSKPSICIVILILQQPYEAQAIMAIPMGQIKLRHKKKNKKLESDHAV